MVVEEREVKGRVSMLLHGPNIKTLVSVLWASIIRILEHLFRLVSLHTITKRRNFPATPKPAISNLNRARPWVKMVKK